MAAMNPILAELRRQQQTTSVVNNTPRLIQPPASDQAPPPITPIPSSGAPPQLPAPIMPPVTAPRGTIAGDQAEMARKEQTGSGISQIHSKIENSSFGKAHPFLGKALGWAAQVPLTLADVAASAVAPEITANLPGTEYHHDRLVKQGQRSVAQEVANQEKQAQTQETQARTAALANPSDEYSTVSSDQGLLSVNRRTGQATPLTVNGEVAQPVEKPAPQNIHVLPSGEVISVNRDPKTGRSTAEVVYQGDPAVKTEVKQLEVNGKPHQVLINAQTGEQIKDLGETGEKPPVVNVNAGTAALDRESSRFAKPYQDAYNVGNKTLERIDLTRRNVDAGYVGQGLAIPELLTSLVSGQGTGIRITQPELNAITKARGIKGDAESFFNRIAGKGSLTDEDKAQIKGVLADAARRLQAKIKINSDALDAINGAGSREEIIKADKEARQKLNDFERGGGGTQEYEATAVGKDGHRIGLKGGKWYDVQTGKAL